MGPARGVTAPTAAKPAPGPYSIIKTIPDGDAFWDYAMFEPTEKRLYVAREDGVTVVDLPTGKVTERLIDGKQVHAVVALSKGRALVTNGGTDTAVIFDRATGKVLRTIPTSKKPDGAVLDPSSGLVLIMTGIGDEAMFVNADTGAVLGRVKLEGEPGSPVVDGKGRLYVNVTDHSEVTVIDIASRKAIKKYPLPKCEDASPLALDKADGVLLAGCANEKAVAVQAATGKVLGEVKIAKYPDVIMYDPLRKVFYVPCVIPGTLDVVRLGKGGAPELAASEPVAFGVHTGALDVAGGRLYLPAGDIRIPTVKGGRPTLAPGSFKIFVIDVSRHTP
jgi:DNA-binding beta-propeller fold protein YncE